LQREFDILKRVAHPNIIQALDYVHPPCGSSSLVLELFVGSTLDVAVRASPQGHFSEFTSKGQFRMILSAVQHIHGLQVLHRDIKAENILVSADLSMLKLVDFNTAHSLAEADALTSTGDADYAAPEVLVDGDASGASDVWSAGLCLHLMLTGRLPRRSSSFISKRAFAAVVASDPVSLTGLRVPPVSARCVHMLEWCLRIDPGLRCSAAELLGDDWFGDESMTF